jgi:hypothetical protein
MSETTGDHRIGLPTHADHLRDLRREDQDRQRVDEPGPHRPRHESHQHVELGQSERDLEQPREHRGDKEILKAVRVNQRGRNQGDRAGRARNHRWAPACKGYDDADHERCEQADFGVDASDERERDDFGDEREGADHSGEHVAPRGGRAAEPFGAVMRES